MSGGAVPCNTDREIHRTYLGTGDVCLPITPQPQCSVPSCEWGNENYGWCLFCCRPSDGNSREAASLLAINQCFRQLPPLTTGQNVPWTIDRGHEESKVCCVVRSCLDVKCEELKIRHGEAHQQTTQTGKSGKSWKAKGGNVILQKGDDFFYNNMKQKYSIPTIRISRQKKVVTIVRWCALA